MCGHQIVEMGLARLYRVTLDRSLLEQARFFLEQRGRHESRALYPYADDPGYSQDHLPVLEQTEAVGHAVRAAYMYCGMADVAALLPDAAYAEAIKTIWEDVVESKIYLTGGIGARHRGEAFGSAFELPNATAYAETCASIGSVMWNHRLFLLTGDSQYCDVLEQTLYNGLLSGVSLGGDRVLLHEPAGIRREVPVQPRERRPAALVRRLLLPDQPVPLLSVDPWLHLCDEGTGALRQPVRFKPR